MVPEAYRYRIESLRRLIAAFDIEIDGTARLTRERLGHDPGFAAVRTIPGVGPILGAVFVAEIGDVTRFSGPAQLASWAGLTPKHHESDTTVHRGRITKQGSRLVRWAAVEAVQRTEKYPALGGSGAGCGQARPQHCHRRRGPGAGRNGLLCVARSPCPAAVQAGSGGVITALSRSARVVLVMTPTVGVVAPSD